MRFYQGLLPAIIWDPKVKAPKVEFNNGFFDTDDEDIIAFCRDRLTHFKCPKDVEFGEIPRTSAGKVQKYVLRQKEKEKYAGKKGVPRV